MEIKTLHITRSLLFSLMVLEKVTGYLRFSRECTLEVKDMHCYSVNMTYSVRTRLSLVVFSGSRRNVYDGALNNIIDIIQTF